ncbi:MAG: phosphatidate cytidylyltransferase [Defluviitaleaceae bacterium]|nr:phosphatidate cytidylyltransferase [Defluviitaleaceae bacterium]MCL2239628.1 phosphatidate cytidylyltransferase [Defluviitaleaceae bacterium]
MSSVAKRVITGIVGLPLVVAVVHIGGIPLVVVCAFAALVGLRELYLAFAKEDKPIHAVGYLATVGYYIAIYFFGPGYWLLISLTLFMIAVQTCLVIFFRHLPLEDCVTAVYGFLYVPFLLSFIVLVREHEALGAFYVWLIFISSFGCDTFAYITGMTLGRRKLEGSPSPSKSLEGLVGGVVGATLLGLLYGWLVTRFFGLEFEGNFMLNAAAISFVGAGFSIIGDMAASAIKRHTKIKDFGYIIPGHGGILDRMDSIVVVAPMVYLVINLLIWVPVWPWI